VQPRPTLLNSCAKAATAAEARYRIDAPIVPTRATRIVALDAGAAPVVRRVAEQEWAHARFFTCDVGALAAEAGGDAAAPAGGLRLRAVDGALAGLNDELTGVDVAVMVATDDEGAAAASDIGLACSARGIMTAGLILGAGKAAGAAVAALRPYARFILVSQDEQDVSEVLTALRA
jgi:hypothetical protein